MATTDVVTPNRRGARSREAVLRAAERVMATDGYAGTSVARVVEEAGVPASSIYHYFGSKDGLLLAVLERGARRFFADLDAHGIGAGLAAGQIEDAVEGLRKALDAHPDFLRLLVVMTVQPPRDATAQAHDSTARIRHEARGLLAAQCAALTGHADPGLNARLARLALALIDGAFIAAQADDGVTLASTLDLLPHLLLTAISEAP